MTIKKNIKKTENACYHQRQLTTYQRSKFELFMQNDRMYNGN